ncbi:MAG TPA: hypothetical protein VF085_08790 [Solirubrobacterales bacterium]
MRRQTFGAYGLRVRFDFDLAIVEQPSGGEPEPYEQVDLSVSLVDKGEIGGRWSDAHGVPSWQTTFPSHCHVRLDRGQAGDHLLTFGRRASFHLDRDGRTLLCACAEPDSPEWQRFLLDTVLYCVSLIRGFEALHASAVCMDGAAGAFVGASGVGKSALAAELVRRGHSLFADDVLALSRTDRGVLAHAAPPLMTLPGPDAELGDAGEPLTAHPESGTSLVRVRRSADDSRPLARIFILDRRSRAALQPLRETAHGRLLPHMLSLDRRSDRALSRFALLDTLVAETPVFRLCVEDGNLAEAADVVEATMRSDESAVKVDPSPMRHASAA